MSRFPVLMYHRIVSPRCPVPGGDHDESMYGVELDAFERQLDALAENGLVGVSMDRIAGAHAGDGVPASWVGLTFDDGNESDVVHAAPLLRERGFGATFFVCGARVGAAGGLGRGDVAELARGFHVGSHGMTHRFMTDLDAAEETAELRESRDLIADITGADVDHFAPPGGRYTARTLEALEALGYRTVCTSDFGFNATSGAPRVYRRIPVTRATDPSTFASVLAGKRARLLPVYLRTGVLSALRGLLGERAYGRLRSRVVGER